MKSLVLIALIMFSCNETESSLKVEISSNKIASFTVDTNPSLVTLLRDGVETKYWLIGRAGQGVY